MIAGLQVGQRHRLAVNLGLIVQPQFQVLRHAQFEFVGLLAAADRERQATVIRFDTLHHPLAALRPGGKDFQHGRTDSSHSFLIVR